MKVGTDGVLLGAWADLESSASILDIGTGTGLIALMAAQRNPSAQIDAIEPEPNAWQQAQENIASAPWNERIRVYHTPLQEFVPSVLYDSIICNPPFFVHSTLAPDAGRTMARHSDSLPHDILIRKVKDLLQPDGNFYVILPTEEAGLFIRNAGKSALYPQHITYVLPNPGKPHKRLLIKFTSRQIQVREDELIIEISRHNYSEKYIALTRDFYLNF